MSVSVFDHPFLSGLLGDEEVGACFSVEADIAALLAFEAALARAETAEGVIPTEAGQAIMAAIERFTPDMDGLRDGTARDGVVVPALVAQLRRNVGEPYAQWVHFGATSQDAIDTSLAIRMSRALDIIERRMGKVIESLETLSAREGKKEVMAHTRMQAAVPVAAARKVASWRDPLRRHRESLAGLKGNLAVLHFGGAAGTLDKLGDKSTAVTRNLAAELGLAALTRARHGERDVQAQFASWLSLVTGGLGKTGADIALMAQSEISEIRLAKGGGSSAMPHKMNPVDAEMLVTFARFNATLVSGMHHALVHENERSGAAWTLEWMLLPQMTVATAAALRTAADLLDGLEFVERKR